MLKNSKKQIIEPFLYLGMHVYLCGKNAKNTEYSKIMSKYISFITDVLKNEKEKYKVGKENLN